MKTALASFTSISILLLASCAEKEMKRISVTELNRIEDSIPRLIPGVQSIHTMQHDEDLTKVAIVAGTPSFYTADDNRKQEAAVRCGIMLLRVMSPDNSLHNGTLVFSKKDSNENKIPDDGLKFDMKLDSLRSVVYPAK